MMSYTQAESHVFVLEIGPKIHFIQSGTLFPIHIMDSHAQKQNKGSSCDPGEYWWPRTYSTWTPTIVSFCFLVSLIVGQFTIFGSFWVLNFWIRFEALVLEQIFLTMYHVRQTQVVCQSYDPRKLMYQVTQWGSHSCISPSMVTFLDVQGFHCFSIIYRPSILIVAQS